MRHPPSVWTDPSFADEPLDRLVLAYRDHLRGRSKPASPDTVRKYIKSLQSLVRSIEARGEPLVLGSVTPAAAERWIQERRARGLSEEGNATELVSVKVFTSKYVWKELELTTVDLLRKVPRITVPDKPAQVLTQAERERVLECFDRPTFEDVRNRALVACYMATGLRFKEVLNLRLDDVDRVTGDIVVLAKGGKVRPARLSPRALKYVREYIKARPRVAADRLWLMADGRELTVFAARAVFTRLKKRSGIPRLKAHLLRHGFAQAALAAGAHPGLVQDMLGHTTAVMTRRYLGWEKATQAAKAMPQYAPI